MKQITFRSIRSIIAQQYVRGAEMFYGISLLRHGRPTGRPYMEKLLRGDKSPVVANRATISRSPYNFPLILSILFNVSSTKMICLIFTRKSSLIYSSM